MVIVLAQLDSSTDGIHLLTFILSQWISSSCNSGSKWPLAIRKNSVPQRGVEPRPLANRASIIPLDYQDTWSLSHSPLQGESMSSCVSCSEITHWPNVLLKHRMCRQWIKVISIKMVIVFCASARSRTPAS